MAVLQNNPLLWRDKMPVHSAAGHKYDRGIAVIYGAPKMTGATRLAARGCSRIGAGLVKVIAPDMMGDLYRTVLHEEIIVEDIEYREYPARGESSTGYSSQHHVDDPRCRALLMGPGCTPFDFESGVFRHALTLDHINGIVLDAGAFLYWQGEALDLAPFASDKVVFTPHEGEFKKVFRKSFGETIEEKMEVARWAAQETHAVMLLKGAQTVISNGIDVVVQDRPVPELATAGAGDVLAGMITGLIAQGMEPKWAAAASAWIHAEAGARFGKGLVAGDLPEVVPAVLKELV